MLALVTLFIGWFIWLLIVWARGQTLGKQLLGMRVVRLREGRKAGWGLMFVRDFLVKGLLFGTIIVTVTLGLGLLLKFWLVWDKKPGALGQDGRHDRRRRPEQGSRVAVARRTGDR
jgi:uncharacterized RDD family membrane protein YckC